MGGMRTCISCIYLERVYGYSRKESTGWCNLLKLYTDSNPCEQYEKAVRYQDRGIIPCLICESDYPQYEADVYELKSLNIIITDDYFHNAKICANCHKGVQEIKGTDAIKFKNKIIRQYDNDEMYQAGGLYDIKKLSGCLYYLNREVYEYIYFKKDMTPDRRMHPRHIKSEKISFCMLIKCGCCGKWGNVKDKSLTIYRMFSNILNSQNAIWEDVLEEPKMQCDNCWRITKKLLKEWINVLKTKKVINKLKREVANVRRNKNNGGIERLSGKNDVGGPGQRVEP